MSRFSFQILGSSSSGNCAVLRSPNCTVLIDAGFSGAKTERALRGIGLSLADIDAVFFTHEHIDHCLGAKALARNAPHIQFFANRATAEAIESRHQKECYWNVFDSGNGGCCFEFSDLRIRPFWIPHDASDPVGYVFECGGSTAGTSEKLAWLTDCGKITHVVRHAVADVDTLVIEANYDDKMLSQSTRPASLKQRIRGGHGHLSNDATATFLREYENDHLQRVFFAHVSRECNSCDLIRRVCVPAISALLPNESDISVIDPQAMLPANGGWGF